MKSIIRFSLLKGIVKGKKELLSNLLNCIGAYALLKRLNLPNLVVFNYHRIYHEPLKTNFDEGVYGHSAEFFEKQIIFLKQSFDVIDEASLIKLIESGKPITQRTALITFDDGYIDNYEIAYPILKAHNTPATFFIPINQIEGLTYPWWDAIAYTVKLSTKKTIKLQGKSLNIGSDSGRRKTIRDILQLFKNTPHQHTDSLLAELHQECRLEQTQDDVTQATLKQFMNWEQIAEVTKNNITIGSHTINHPVLANLSDEQQAFELNESKLFLEKKLNHSISSISYPVGSQNTFNDKTKELAKQAGYKIGFSFLDGYNNKLIADIYQIPRIKLNCTGSLFKAQSLMPRVF
ncbi:MAG: peptidoglycan/xylan/chitin deacetylase (PgdA/CDA1 family) [Gammaproteobacteria bacterium]|jgi:peptidoglycan/xylan/chitin deacetylase (PgdA/CDA1 family)